MCVNAFVFSTHRNHFILMYIILFIGCAGSLLLCGVFSSCSERVLLSVAVCGLLKVVASLVAEHGFWAMSFSSCGVWAQ